eukprot:9503785-Pyramimonas_sp.AAC.2
MASQGPRVSPSRRACQALRCCCNMGNAPEMDYYVHTDMTPGEKSLPWQHLQSQPSSSSLTLSFVIFVGWELLQGPLPEQTLIKHAEEALSHV